MISIRKVSLSSKKEVEDFKKTEWALSDAEKGLKYDKETNELVATDKEEIVGYAKYTIVGGTALLQELLVAKNARNQGVGRALLKKYEAKAKKEKCHQCYLETSDKHQVALAFYKKEKYKIIAELKDHKFRATWYILSKEIP